jgi:membrane protein YdbS with pleckstrin-like domain
MPSWWHYGRQIFFVLAFTGGGVYLLFTNKAPAPFGAALIGISILMLISVTMARRYTSWSLTSDRLIERRGWLASHRREMELADVRSIEVDRSVGQRMLGLGNVMIASAASADFMIRLWDVPDPERVAEILRQARLKRLA